MTAFVRRLLREQPVRFVLVVSVLGLAGLLEGAGVATVIPLLQLLSGQSAGAQLDMVGRLVEKVLAIVGLPFSLATVLGLVLFFVLAQQAAILLQQKLAQGSIFGFEASLRNRLYRSVFTAGWPFFLKEKTGDMVSALTMESQRAGQAYQYLNVMLGSVIVIAVYLGLAFLLSWRMTLVVIVVGAAAALLLRRRVQRGAAFGQAISGLNTELQREAVENVSGAKMIKGSGIEKNTIARFTAFVNRLANQQYRMQMNQAWLRATYDSISITMVFVGIFVAATRLKMPFYTLIIFMFIFYRLSPRISNLQGLAHFVLSYLPALDHIDAICDRAATVGEPIVGTAAARFEQRITFEDVSFSYDDSTEVLSHLDLVIEKGAHTAVVGPSGAGKTTVIDLLMGLFAPGAGRVLVDGLPLTDIDVHLWRDLIGYVAQDSVFFHASVRENITLTCPEATDEDVVRAATMAHAHDFVTELQDGYDTVVGDRGVRLSGGQRQRLALARALVRRPRILILDEATSALDAESEQRIQQAIEELAGSITVVVVTHRLATVKGADPIYVLQDGRLTEQGTFAELMSANGSFARLKRLQDLDVGEPAQKGAVSADGAARGSRP